MTQRRKRRGRERRPSPVPGTGGRRSSRGGPLRVRQPADLLALVPYLLGFHPEESVVAVYLQQGRVILTARVDLPEPEAASELAAELGGLSRRQQAQEVVLVAYSDRLEPARALLAGVLEAWTGARLAEVLQVCASRWWGLLCPGECCPPEGTPYDPGASSVTAEAVYAGMAVRRNRDELEQWVAGPPDADERVLAELADGIAREVAELSPTAAAEQMEHTVRSALAEGCLTERDCLRLATLAVDVRWRDLAWAMITRDDAQQHVRLWRRVVDRTPEALAAAPLCLLGMAAWLDGDGALQNCCAERVARLRPSYSMGALLSEISARALPPSLWDSLGADLQAELGVLAGSRRSR